MAKRGDPGVLRYVVNFLRFHAGVQRRKRMTQAEFGQACRVDQAEISRQELGKVAPSEEQLRRMAQVAGVEWPGVVTLRELYTRLIPILERGGASGRLPRLRDLEPVLLAVSPFFLVEASEPPKPALAEERSEAGEIWEVLEKRPLAVSLRVIEASPDAGNWALAERVCAASLKRAAGNVEEALELAELAVTIAERVPGAERWRSRLLGYCWAHVANAHRVANDLAAAEQTFTLAWDYWRKGMDLDPSSAVLGEWLLPALEASLRRDQRRFPEALALLKEARNSPGGAAPAAELMILLNEASLFSLMGEPERSLAASTVAAELCEAAGDRRSLLVLRFNIAEDLLQLERVEEAAQRLPQIREFALLQANELDLLRLAWLTARVAAGQGRVEEAMTGLNEVSDAFFNRGMPYDAALSSLDLAVLLLDAGRTLEVKKLAVAMGRIFKAKGISREALASLKLFCEAARQEAATVELARRVIDDIEKARRGAPPRG